MQQMTVTGAVVAITLNEGTTLLICPADKVNTADWDSALLAHGVQKDSVPSTWDYMEEGGYAAWEIQS